MDFDGLGLCFHFGRWCCLQVYSLDDSFIMESVVLRSGPVGVVLLIFKIWLEITSHTLRQALGSSVHCSHLLGPCVFPSQGRVSFQSPFETNSLTAARETDMRSSVIRPFPLKTLLRLGGLTHTYSPELRHEDHSNLNAASWTV